MFFTADICTKEYIKLVLLFVAFHSLSLSLSLKTYCHISYHQKNEEEKSGTHWQWVFLLQFHREAKFQNWDPSARMSVCKKVDILKWHAGIRGLKFSVLIRLYVIFMYLSYFKWSVCCIRIRIRVRFLICSMPLVAFPNENLFI